VWNREKKVGSGNVCVGGWFVLCGRRLRQPLYIAWAEGRPGIRTWGTRVFGLSNVGIDPFFLLFARCHNSGPPRCATGDAKTSGMSLAQRI
jgi:hypothetical protein